MDYGSPSKPTDHKLPKRLFYPNTRYSTSTARPSRPPTPHTKKHATNVDTGILYTTNHPQLTNRKTGNGTTYSGTTLHSAKTSAPISDTDKHFPKDHKLRKNFNRNTIKISSAAWITLSRLSTITISAFCAHPNTSIALQMTPQLT